VEWSRCRERRRRRELRLRQMEEERTTLFPPECSSSHCSQRPTVSPVRAFTASCSGNSAHGSGGRSNSAAGGWCGAGVQAWRCRAEVLARARSAAGTWGGGGIEYFSVAGPASKFAGMRNMERQEQRLGQKFDFGWCMWWWTSTLPKCICDLISVYSSFSP
jgi:hypothetical protein